MWLQRGMRLGRDVFYAASTTNAYATGRRVAEERDPALEPSTVDFAVGVAVAMGAGFRNRMGATYLPLKYDKPTSRSVTSVRVQTDVAQSILIAGQGKAVPEMLCGTADVVDPELTPSGFTPPEESRPLQAQPQAGRAGEYKKRGYKVGKRLQSTVCRPERPVLEPPIPELRPRTPTQAPESAAEAVSDELWRYKIPLKRRRTPSPSSSSSSNESTSSQSQKSGSLRRRRGKAESFESVMPKLTREVSATPCPREKSSEKKRGKFSRTRRIQARKTAKKHNRRSESGHGDDDVKHALRQLTREVRRSRVVRSDEPFNPSRSPVRSGPRRRVPHWSRSGWRIGARRHGDGRRGGRR